MWVSVPKIVLVTRKTRLEGLRARFNTARQAKFYLERLGQDFDEYAEEEEVYGDVVKELQKRLGELDRPVHLIDRSYLPNYLFHRADVLVTVGPDGLVVNTAKYLDSQPIIAVNPDPARIDGILLPFAPPQAPAAVARAVRGAVPCHEITMAEVKLNDGQQMLAFNDFLIGCRSHASARYQLDWVSQSEEQSSSGVLVSTGAGSTGWLSSCQNMARSVLGLMESFQHPRWSVAKPLSALELTSFRLSWEDPRLVFTVREPFASRVSGTRLTAGMIEPGQELRLESRMPEGGVIFSDGIETDALAFNAGAVASVRAAQKRTRLMKAL